MEALVLQDLVEGRNEWCNIPEILRATLKLMWDGMIQQNENIARMQQEEFETINEALAKKANKDTVAAALHRKANKNEVEGRMDQLAMKITRIDARMNDFEVRTEQLNSG